MITPFIYTYIHRYIANLALDSLSEMFTGAKLIMDWLATCATLVSSQVRIFIYIMDSMNEAYL